MNIELHMQLGKETKGTYVYTDDTLNAPIPTLYIKKAAMPNGPDAEILVILKSQE